MKAKLFVENEHGNFEIEVGDKVIGYEFDDCIKRIGKHVGGGEVYDFRYKYVTYYRENKLLYSIELQDIYCVKHRHEWTNPLGNKEVAWDDDTPYVVFSYKEDDSCTEELKIMEIILSSKIKEYKQFFTKLEDAEKWVQQKEIEKKSKELDEKIVKYITSLGLYTPQIESLVAEIKREYINKPIDDLFNGIVEILKVKEKNVALNCIIDILNSSINTDSELAAANCDHKEYVYYKDKKYEYVPYLVIDTCTGCDIYNQDCPISSGVRCRTTKSILREVIDHKPEVKLDPQFTRKCYHIMF